MGTNLKIIVVFLLIVSLFFTYPRLERKKEEIRDVNGKTIIALSRNFRQVLASLIWLRIDYYHHTSDNKTLFNKEILPLMKLTITLDPHFVRAYSMLAFHLATYYNRINEAVKLLRKGIELNKDSTILSELYGELGRLEFVGLHNTGEAELMFSRAIETYTLDCDLDDFYVELLYYKYLLKKSGRIVPKFLSKLIDKIKNETTYNLVKNKGLEKEIENFVNLGIIRKDKKFDEMRKTMKYTETYAPEESTAEHLEGEHHHHKCNDPNCDICKHEFMVQLWHRHYFNDIKKRTIFLGIFTLFVVLIYFLARSKGNNTLR